MEKVYLVYRNTFDDCSIGENHIFEVFDTLDKAREYYEDLVDMLTNDYEGVIDCCDIGTNSCEFYNNGEYSTWHDVIIIKELTINK